MGAITVIIGLLNSLTSLVPVGTALYEKFVGMKTQAQQWADTNHVPTAEEWAALDTEIGSLEAQIDAAAAGN